MLFLLGTDRPMPTIPKGDTMSDYTIDTADICKHCPYIIRECGEVLGCRCDIYGPESCDVANQ